MKNIHSLFSLLKETFKEKRLVWNSTPENLQTLTVGELKDESHMGKDAEAFGEKAAKEFEDRMGEIQKQLDENPGSLLSEFEATFDPKILEAGLGKTVLNLTDQYFKPQIGDKLFPGNSVAAHAASLAFGASFVEKTQTDLSKLIDEKKLKSIKFSPTKTKDKKGTIGCTFKGEKGEELKTYEVPFVPEFFQKIREQKENVRKNAIEQRKLEQKSILEDKLNSPLLKLVDETESLLDLGRNVIMLAPSQLQATEKNTTLYQVYTREGGTIPFVVAIDYSDAKNMKIQLRKTDEALALTKWGKSVAEIQDPQNPTYRSFVSTRDKLKLDKNLEKEAKTPERLQAQIEFIEKAAKSVHEGYKLNSLETEKTSKYERFNVTINGVPTEIVVSIERENPDKALIQKPQGDIVSFTSPKEEELKAYFTKALEKVQVEEILKTPEKTQEETEKQKSILDEAGVTVEPIEGSKKLRIIFFVNGAERSFIATQSFVDKLMTLGSAKEVTLECYKKLLSIIQSDGSISTNVHEVAGENRDLFRKSNETMKEFVRNKGEVKETSNEALKKGYIPVGTFWDLEVYTDKNGTLYTAEGKKLIEYSTDRKKGLENRDFIIADATSSPAYQRAIKEATEKTIEGCAASKDETKQLVGFFGPEKTAVFTDKDGSLYAADNVAIADVAIAGGVVWTAEYKDAQAELYGKELEATKPGTKESLELKQKKLLLQLSGVVNDVNKEVKEETEGLEMDGYRTIRIDQELKNQQYKIFVNGNLSKYVVELASGMRDKEVEFSIKIPGTSTLYRSFESQERNALKEQLRKIVEGEVDARKINNLDEATNRLRTAGLEITDPPKLDRLTGREYKVLKNAATQFQGILSTNEEAPRGAHTLAAELKSLSAKFLPELGKVNSEIRGMSFTYLKQSEKFSWSAISDFGNNKDLAAKILIIKRAELEEGTPKFSTFYERTITGDWDNRKETNEQTEIGKYQKALDELMNQDYAINETIHTLSSDDFVKYWEKMDGSRMINELMTAPPFSLHREYIPTMVMNIVYGKSFLDPNREVEFGDIFDYMGGFPGLPLETAANPNGMPQELQIGGSTYEIRKDGKDFVKGYKKLIELGAKATAEQARVREAMYKQMIIPMIQLLKAMERLRLDPKKGLGNLPGIDFGGGEDEVDDLNLDERTDLTPDQLKMRKGVMDLCDFKNHESGRWERFIGALCGRDEMVDLSAMDGSRFQVQEGTLQRYNDPVAAYAMFINRKGLYKERTDPPELIPDKVVEETNKLLRLGYMNLALMSGPDADSNLKEFAPKYAPVYLKTMDDFYKMTDEQKQAFQLGFLVERSSKENRQIKESMDVVKEIENENVRLIVSQLLEQGVPPRVARLVGQRIGLMVGGAMSFENGNLKAGGFAAGVSLELIDGFSLQFLGGYYGGGGTSGFAGGIGCSFRVINTQGFTASVGMMIGTQGLSLGVDGTIKIGNRDLTLFTGVGFGWKGGILPGGGISFEIRDTETAANEKIAEKLDASAFSVLWDKWKELKGADPETKYQELVKLPGVGKWVQLVQQSYGATNEDVVYALQNVESEIIYQAFVDLTYKGVISHVGFYYAQAGAVPIFIPTVSFHLGSAKIFVPRRKEIAKMMVELSDVRVTDKLVKSQLDAAEKILREALKTGKIPEGEFIEQTPNLVYSRGKLLALEESTTVDLTKWETNVDAYNEQLTEANLSLKSVSGGKVELVVHNTEAKDIEIVPDPALSKDGSLAIVRDGGRFFLEGNLHDLQITRERFTHPGRFREDGASVRDVIVLRQKGSLRGNRDGTWSRQNSSKIIQKRMGEDWETVEGADPDSLQTNIIEVAGYSTTEYDKLSPSDKLLVDEYRKNTPDLTVEADKTKLEGVRTRAEERREAIGVMSKKEYEKQEVQAEVFKKLDKLFDKPDFAREFKANVDNPEGLTALVQKHIPEINDKTLNQAVTYLLNKWYSAFILEDIDNLTPKKRRAIRERVERRVEYVRTNVFKPAFEAAYKNLEPKPAFPADKMVDEVIERTYGELLKKLRNPNVSMKEILSIVPIPEQAYFFSGSRKWEKGKKEGAMSYTVNYEDLPSQEKFVDTLGFIQSTINKFPANSTEALDKAIRRTLLEIASPIPKDSKEFLQSPLAKKIMHLASFELLVGEKNSKLINEVLKGEKPLEGEHAKAIEELRKLILDIRNHQETGKMYVKQIGGLTISIMFQTDVVAGAYAICANPSFYATEIGIVHIQRGVHTLFEESTETRLADQGRADASLSALLAVQTKKTTVPGEEPDKNEVRTNAVGDVDATKVESVSGDIKPASDKGIKVQGTKNTTKANW